MVTSALVDLLQRAIFAARDAGALPLSEETFAIQMNTSRNKLHGDYSCNIALTLKKATGLSDSREIAQRIVAHIPTDSLVNRVEIAGPGFLNFYLKPTWLQDALVTIEAQESAYGTNNSLQNESILIEFVSANPTGPISVVNGRAAALGDTLGNLLVAQGAKVGREYYINDALNSLQLEKFAASVCLRYLQHLGHPLLIPAAEDEGEDRLEQGDPAKETLHFPKDGYRGEYVKDIARAIYEEVGDQYAQTDEAERNAYFRTATLQSMIAVQRTALEAFGVRYDTWFYESELYAAGEVEKTIAYLKEKECAYFQDGALWLRATQFGDEKDRVLVRSNEKATYIAADIAYHRSKFLRGYNRLINIWGADHHGYVARLKAGVASIGYDSTQLEIILTQMVSLVRDGEAVIGGKRKGNVIELKEDLIEDIGKDAARFYFLLNSYETPATVDVELAKKQSNENPVYYVQYAHARLSNILRRAEEMEVLRQPASETDRALLTEQAELDVLRKLQDYPDEIAAAARDFAPHRLTRYAMELGSLLNVFYETCRVLPSIESPQPVELTLVRLALVNSARIVLKNLLGMLGVSAPEKM